MEQTSRRSGTSPQAKHGNGGLWGKSLVILHCQVWRLKGITHMWWFLHLNSQTRQEYPIGLTLRLHYHIPPTRSMSAMFTVGSLVLGKQCCQIVYQYQPAELGGTRNLPRCKTKWSWGAWHPTPETLSRGVFSTQLDKIHRGDELQDLWHHWYT